MRILGPIVLPRALLMASRQSHLRLALLAYERLREQAFDAEERADEALLLYVARLLAWTHIRERIGQVKADQRARGRSLGGSIPFGYRLGDDGELIPHEAEQEAVREMVALRAQGRALRAVPAEMQAKGHSISHEGVAGVLRGRQGVR
jgi:hypothetical protein